MGGWNTVIMFIAHTALVSSYKLESTTLIPPSNPTINEELLNVYKNIHASTQALVNPSKSLFNNIFWAPPIKFDSGFYLEENPKPNVKYVDDKQSKNNDERYNDVGLTNLNGQAIYFQQTNSPEQEHSTVASNINELSGVSGNNNIYNDYEAVEKQAEALVEKQFNEQQRNRRQNNDEGIQSDLQPSEDYHGEGSDYSHHSYTHDDDHDDHEHLHPKKKEIHYHQHKHLHEHDHLQEHKHHHLNDHKAVHHHGHKAHADHKHQHEAKHQHHHKAEHHHDVHADHKHEHQQHHKHHHKNEHKHDHWHQSKHEHWAKHGHHHKEDAKHLHEQKAKHDHHHDHEHKSDAKHHHNHWSDHKHWHDHHETKHHHKRNSKIKVYYKKHG